MAPTAQTKPLQEQTVCEIITKGNALWEITKNREIIHLKKYLANNPEHGLPQEEQEAWDQQIVLVEELDRRIDLLCDRSPANTHYPFKGMTTTEVATWFGIPEDELARMTTTYVEKVAIADLRNLHLSYLGHPDRDHNREIPTWRGSLITCFSRLEEIACYTAIKLATYRAYQVRADETEELPKQVHVSTMIIHLQGMENGLKDDFSYQGV